jgi:regulator of CtrA degradation
MTNPIAINPKIIEDLYCEALILSDEVRAAFDLSGRAGRSETSAPLGDSARVALSCEALRTTTRMMHALAWLLNHRAYLAGELSEFQLRRHGQLSPDRPSDATGESDPIDPETRRLIEATERFYSRLMRLDREWRERDPHTPVARLRDRIGSALAG